MAQGRVGERPERQAGTQAPQGVAEKNYLFDRLRVSSIEFLSHVNLVNIS
jgi:hypothetical protein